MKFSYRTHPVLKMLEMDNPIPAITVRTGAKIDTPEVSLFLKQTLKFWPDLRAVVVDKVYHISAPFLDASIQAYPKLVKSGVLSEVDSFRGVFIYSRDGGNMAIVAEISQVKGALSGMWFLFNGDQLVLGCVPSGRQFGEYAGFADKEAIKNLSEFQDCSGHSLLAEVASTALGFEIFKRFANTELKELPANTRTEDIRCKYVNDTNLNITHLDSTWFTTLVKSGAFKVRGHFRLQPCGEGLKDRKLKWIADFGKKGYTRRAKMLSK